MNWSKSVAAMLLLGTTVEAACPFAGQGRSGAGIGANPHAKERRAEYHHGHQRRLANATRDAGIPEGGFAAVREDIKQMLVTSQEFFPADFEPPIGPHYGGKISVCHP
jgi:hypothetical protein